MTVTKSPRVSSSVLEVSPLVHELSLDTGPRNVLGIEAVRELRASLASDEPPAVIVLRGRRDGFSVGLDNAVLAAEPRQREELLAEMGCLLLDMLQCATRFVAVCEGHAVAAGAMLLLVSDVRIGVPGTYKVGFTEPGLGMPLPGLPALLARERLDRRMLHRLAVLGEIVPPDVAAECGFFDELTPAEHVDERVAAWTATLGRLTDGAYRGSMRSVHGDALEAIEAMVEQQRNRAQRSNTPLG